MAQKLAGRIKTFVYSEQQKQVFARDGIDTLTSVYGSDSRTVAVLFRSGWGATRWTRIEETAIKARWLNEGPGFLSFVRVEQQDNPPAWYPSHFFWFDFPEWGIDGTAAALEAHVGRAGGTPRVETVSERAARLANGKRLAADRENYLRSEEAVAAQRAEYEDFRKLLEAVVAETVAGGIQLTYKTHSLRQCSVRGQAFTVIVSNDVYYSNSLDKAELNLALWEGFPPGFGWWDSEEPKHRSTTTYKFDRTLDGRLGWSGPGDSGGDVISSRKLAELVVGLILDQIELPGR